VAYFEVVLHLDRKKQETLRIADSKQVPLGSMKSYHCASLHYGLILSEDVQMYLYFSYVQIE
jgi:hypothetical protein